jgi:predicted ATP-dependent protease
MAARQLKFEEVGLPQFAINPEDLAGNNFTGLTYFDLSSHCKAKQSIDFGLKMRHAGSNVFVVGGDRSGRLTATVEYLQEYIKQFPPESDWLYLNNFSSTHRPIPYRMPAGKGYDLKVALGELVEAIYDIFNKTFSNPAFISQINAFSTALENEVRKEIDKVQEFARDHGLRIESSEEEFTVHPLSKTGGGGEELSYTSNDLQEIRDQLAQITAMAHFKGRELHQKIQELKRLESERILFPLMKPIIEVFSPFIADWLHSLAEDILEHVDDFLIEGGLPQEIENRYAVNLLVDNRNMDHPNVIVEPNPTYENLFGSIKYRSSQAGYVTDFTLIRPGSLHQANGGILILRAESLASNPDVWVALKAALRDRSIRIEERHRENAMPILDAPEPKSIPLNVQIFMIGAPIWYYSFFYNDPEFKTYFKIKAEIEPDLPATPQNISVYTKLIRQFALQNNKKDIEAEAIQYLIGYSSRWIQYRKRLSARFELISDILSEASILASEGKSEVIRHEDVRGALYNRRLRNCGLEDRAHQDIESGLILIDTEGSVIGQVNGLSVLMTGDHQYGLPNRITARTYAGEEGIVNIERLTEMGGPIQQKGALILDGYLKGKFAQQQPVSCTCSLTFEQSYGEIEGDSASLAELVAILSSLASVSVRQDIAVTGSINQFGLVQAVGGVNHKIEGFYRLCLHRGLTGKQGVIIPNSNRDHIVLRDDVSEAIARNKFHIWSVATIEEALELLTSMPAGEADSKGNYPRGTIFAAIGEQLKVYQKALQKGK